MSQALAVGETFYEVSHRAIQQAWRRHTVAGRLSVLGWDLFNTLLMPLPASDAWVHEEYHRAVLGRRGVDSFNDVYKFDFAPSGIAVSHVKDDDLVRLKRDHPAEQVRLSAAGIEGEYQLVQQLERHVFFDCSPAWHVPVYWLVKLGSIGYVMSSTWSAVDVFTDDANFRERADVAPRDFTGHDFTAWVYDLHRPEEPYTARGVHPFGFGLGIDRYIKAADLTADERRYVEHQGRLQLLNLFDPFLIGRRGFPVTNPFNRRPLRLTANVGHVLTSFGDTVDANVFLHQDDVKLFVVVHSYGNGQRRFPGIDAEVVDYPVTVRGRPVNISLRGALWLQPADQRFDASDSRPGALLGLTVQRPGRGRIGVYIAAEGKTEGWVAGNVYLGPNVSVRVGVTIELR